MLTIIQQNPARSLNVEEKKEIICQKENIPDFENARHRQDKLHEIGVFFSFVPL
jgi:hypothetical protein